MKIYTKQGDKGFTSTLSGKRLSKAACLIEINGSIDSLHSQIMRLSKTGLFEKQLNRIYDDLMNIATEVSLEEEPTNSIVVSDIKKLEKDIDKYNIPLTRFIKFKDDDAIEFNEARVRCRNLERKIADFSNEHNIRDVCFAYINRLSDLFFTYAVNAEFEGNPQ